MCSSVQMVLAMISERRLHREPESSQPILQMQVLGTDINLRKQNWLPTHRAGTCILDGRPDVRIQFPRCNAICKQLASNGWQEEQDGDEMGFMHEPGHTWP